MHGLNNKVSFKDFPEYFKSAGPVLLSYRWVRYQIRWLWPWARPRL